jgi:hypothetical protein
MNLLVRADATAETGTGHVMRCLELARKLDEARASRAEALGAARGASCACTEEAVPASWQFLGHGGQLSISD